MTAKVRKVATAIGMAMCAILGMGLAGADELPILGPAVALAAFLLGAFASGIYLRHRRRDWHRGITFVLGAACNCLLVTTLALVAMPHPHNATQRAYRSRDGAVCPWESRRPRRVTSPWEICPPSW